MELLLTSGRTLRDWGQEIRCNVMVQLKVVLKGHRVSRAASATDLFSPIY